ncbi:MAG: hypothetical protein EPN14_10115 [Gallionella sp.]|nr:MAG: hypothetical protein EPN14_10115 [Gallionella sp.]
MFSSKNTAAHTGLMKRHTRISLLAIALLGVGVFAPPLAAPVFAADTVGAQKKKSPIAPADAASIQKKKQDYERLAASVKALSGALDRESQKAGIDNTEVLGNVASHLKKAAQLAAAGAYDKARTVLDEGYHTLTVAIVTLENAKNRGMATGRPSPVVTLDPKVSAAEQRKFVAREIDTNKALVDALKHQNDDKKGGKDGDIASIEAAAAEAAAALDAGDIARAGTLIHDANSRVKADIASLQKPPTMQSGSAANEALQRQEGGAKSAEIARSGYVKRKESVVALLEAGKRIEGAEGQKGSSHPELSIAEDILKEAEALAAVERFAEAKIQIDLSYLLAKDAVRSLRGGKKLRADKNFATKADEYKYEQARNDDYQELMSKLISDKTDPTWTQIFEKARNLRRDADGASKSGNFESALRKIDESTAALKTLLRRAGFPIIWRKP